MKTETHVDRELRQALENASRELHALTLLEGHDLADSPGGADEVWIDLRRREFGVTPTLAHILTDKHPQHIELMRLPKV
jgi:hypothetical protein